MASMIRPLLNSTLRQAVSELLNIHRKDKSKRDIALVGSRRSGSTLLMQVLARASGLKSVDQPFSIYSADKPQMRHLPWPAGGLFVSPCDEEKLLLKKYIDDICNGRLHVREPWRFWSPDFHFFTDRVLLKTTDAHYLEPLFHELAFDVILYFRHPIPQALSCARNAWGDKLRFFKEHYVLRTDFLSSTQNELLDRVYAEGNDIDRFVLCWCVENLPLFDSVQKGANIVYYEEMVGDPDVTLEKIKGFCGIAPNQKMRRMFSQASISVKGLSDKSGKDAISRRDTEAITGRWRSQVTTLDIDRIERILSNFPGCPYGVDSDLPLSP